MIKHNIADLFEEIVDANGESTALIDNNVSLRYRDLDELADRFAAWLANNNIGVGDRVGLALFNTRFHVAAIFGCFKAGATPVNVNFRYTAGEIAGVLTDAAARGVIYEPELAAEIAEATVGLSCATLQANEEFVNAMAAVHPAPRRTDRSGDEIYIIYTGGTTGQPKGVLWRHRDLIDAVGLTQNRRGTTRLFTACPLTHGTAQWSVIGTLLGGGTVVFGDPLHLDPIAVWDLVEVHRVNRLVLVGDAMAVPLLDALDANPDRWDLSSLVVLASGGARLSPGVRDGLLAHLPNMAVSNSYGTSESGGHGAQITFAGQVTPKGLGLLAFPLDNATAVLGADNTMVTPGSGEIGRIARKGAIPLGYLNDPEKTAATFPIIDGTRWVVPGDLATLTADGMVIVLGRDRNVINTGGEKVFAENIEQVLVAHPAVVDAVVAGVPDQRWGERVSALVQLRPDASVTPDQLAAHCRAQLAGYKVPRDIRIVSRVRRRHTGKLDRVWAASILVTSP